MLYYSTKNHSEKVNFRQAVVNGQAPDRGLYFPEMIPSLPPGFIGSLKSKSQAQIAFEVIKPFIGDCISDDEIFRISAETVDFDFPLVEVVDGIWALELFHGPTMAFKDVGARFMSRCLGYFSKDNTGEITVLVATSGDTGSAVANGFLGVDGVNVVILYPSGKVSRIQELQLTTLGQNITAIEVEGTFDDCQSMVKDAFMDLEIGKKLKLTSANSINIGRWLPQQIYYFFALRQWQFVEAPVLCVPSGNFGNIAAGLLAFKSGLPVKHFIAANNSNDVFNQYLATATYAPRKAEATLSNAMDVGDPSNFVRIMEMFGHSYDNVKSMISSSCINDEQTALTIRDVFENTGYLLDPHGAVGYSSLQDYLLQNPQEIGIFLATAHPVKFADSIDQITGKTVEIPASIEALLQRQKKTVKMMPGAAHLKDFLMQRSC